MESTYIGLRDRMENGRIIRHAVNVEPPKFKYERAPKASPVRPASPRPAIVEDGQQIWKIPPCISNWKDPPKGYTIPLYKRLGIQEVQIKDNFAKIADALHLAEQKAIDAIAVQELARKATSERTGVAAAAPVPITSTDGGGSIIHGDISVDSERARRDDARKETKEEREEWRLRREKIREERGKERERERRLEAKDDAAMGKKIKITRWDRDGDIISEKVALGMGEVMYDDQRLFNQEKGMMDSGFATDDDEAYNIYGTTQSTMSSTLYRPKKDDVDTPKERLHRENIREERGKEGERGRRLEAEDAAMGKQSKITRDRDRDIISENVALGNRNR